MLSGCFLQNAKFPIPSGLFKDCYISSDQKRELIDLANSNIQVLCANNCSYWSFVKQHNGVNLYEERLGDRYYSVRATTTIKASLSDMKLIFLNNNSLDYRLSMKQMHGSDLLDAEVLYAPTNTISVKAGVLSVKWIALRESCSFTNNRDFCFVDYTREVMNCRDENVLVRSIESTNIPECPPLLSSHNLERAYFTKSAYIMKPLSANTIEVEFVGSMDISSLSSLKKRNYRKFFQKLALDISQIQEMVITTKISSQSLVEPQNWVSDNERSVCLLCSRKFGHFRRRHHCRVCGDVICSKCSMKKNLIVPVFGLQRHRLCKTCLLDSKLLFLNPKGESIHCYRCTIASIRDLEIISTPENKRLCNNASENRKHELNSCDDCDCDTNIEIESDSASPKCDPRFRSVSVPLLSPGLKKDSNLVFHYLERVCETLQIVFKAPIVYICLVNSFNSTNLAIAGLGETLSIPDEFMFSKQVQMEKGSSLVILDTSKMKELSTVSVVEKLGLRFFIGKEINDKKGKKIGTISVCDVQPRNSVSPSQMSSLGDLADDVSLLLQKQTPADIELRLSSEQFDTPEHVFRKLLIQSYKTWIQVKAKMPPAS